jgi:hypothetical protein
VEGHSGANRVALIGKPTDSVQSCREVELSRSITSLPRNATRSSKAALIRYPKSAKATKVEND